MTFFRERALTWRPPIQSAIGAPSGRSVLYTKVQLKRSLWGYQGDNLTPFLKITLSDPKFVSKLRGLFDRGEIGFGGFFDGPTATFESNIAYELRFMIDKQVRPASLSVRHPPAKADTSCLQITGMNWLELTAGKYKIRPGAQKTSQCQLELDCRYVYASVRAQRESAR